MEWFFQISHQFMIPTQEGDQPRHAPAPDHEEYMQPAIPQVPVAFDPPPHAMITKAMRRSQKGWSVCSTLGWSLQAQSYKILCKLASRSPGGCQCRWKCQGSTETAHRALIILT
ncbi:hypothetical protein GmHk_03G006919 [Glycine max]|nr:hypothetical protein GmHk_03G006919 [Glycine max]KAH1256844.1 hypothetical protein GmHk_03G006919 [Glycine max]